MFDNRYIGLSDGERIGEFLFGFEQWARVFQAYFTMRPASSFRECAFS